MMLTLKSVRTVMTMRKRAVRTSSTVRTHAGGGGIACGEADVEPLCLVVLETLGFGMAPDDRDTSSGLGRCMRGRIVAELCWRGMGRQYVLVTESVLMMLDWMVGGENAVAASKAARMRWDFILGNLIQGSRCRGRCRTTWIGGYGLLYSL